MGWNAFVYFIKHAAMVFLLVSFLRFYTAEWLDMFHTQFIQVRVKNLSIICSVLSVVPDKCRKYVCFLVKLAVLFKAYLSAFKWCMVYQKYSFGLSN